MSVRVITHGRSSASAGSVVAAIGVFDGVHVGHQALVAAAAQRAEAHGVPCAVLTFDRDPDQVITPDAAAPQLLSLSDKCRFLGEAGADIVIVIPFDTEIARMSPERFVETVLLVACGPLEIHVGVDFRFGRFATGTVDTLRDLGAGGAFEVTAHELVRLDDAPVTSTRIRTLIAEGSVAEASRLLGRPHRVEGMVVKGRGEGGSRLDIPTANLLPSEHAALPSPGVYAGRALLSDGSTWPAGISVGVPPTFPQSHHVLEAHLLGFEGDLFHHDVLLEFSRRLRPQRAFESMTDLAESIRADLDEVRETETEDRRP